MRDYTTERQTFERDGVVIIKDVLTEADFAPVQAELEAFVDQRARELKAAGKLDNLCEGLDFGYRIVGLYAQCKEIVSGLDIMEMRSKSMFDFIHTERLLDLAEAFLGPELTCNPIQHLRAKMPISVDGSNAFMNVPWHQDAAVTLEEADPTSVYTFWMPMIDANRETGCMEVIPGCGPIGLMNHIPGAYGTEVDPAVLPDTEPVTAACPRGGVVVMNKLTPHHGIPNVSDRARWTIDLRYQVTGQPTGRSFHPDFPVRSRANPASVKRDYAWWCQAWETALVTSKGMGGHRVTKAK
ncbi:MAG: phytanoyl-CoA dioxygenase family protein [Lentisphaerae bacterium]|nr:phytanoyl-CoA dioxygenase family protein [Lentisphaerota bacterium]